MRVKTIIFTLFIILLTTFLLPLKTQAQEKASGQSALFRDIIAQRATDNRVAILHRYLEKYNSPLAPYAQVFVDQADLYQIDWRLVVSISGVESTFGKAVPCTNAWGWGIPDGKHIFCFNSYDEGIRIISRDIRQKYMDRWGATDIWSIGKYYAASPTWASHVAYFMNDLQNFAYEPENQPLPISL